MYMRNLKKKMKTQRIRVKHLHAKLDTKSSKLQKICDKTNGVGLG